MEDVIYLDYNASTPIASEVLDAMMPYLTHHYGNPSSNSHAMSWASAGGIHLARKQIASLFNCEPSEIIFTSGATESTNLALWGVLELQKKTELWTSNAEHSATYQIAQAAVKKGFKVRTFSCQATGLIDLDDLAQELQKQTANPHKIVSLILANNEFGSLYDLDRLSQVCKDHGAFLHLDATQAILTEKIDLSKTPVDLLSFSAHKIYGPKGSGALYVNKNTIGHELEPRIFGGGQEYGLRSGTHNVAGIVGLGEACRLVKDQQSRDRDHFTSLYKNFETSLAQTDVNFFLNGDSKSRIFHNISITFPKHNQIEPLTLVMAPFCLTQGSACGTYSVNQNRALEAIGLSEKEMQNTLRIGLGRTTDVSVLEKLVEKIRQVI